MNKLWQVRGFSLRGKSHEIDDRPNQDNFCIFDYTDLGQLLAVADGAGSYDNSHIASEVLVEKLPHVFTKGRSSRKTLELTINALRDIELTTTLSAVFLKSRKVSTLQVGDSIIILKFRDGSYHLSPRHQGSKPNQTIFLSSNSALDKMISESFPTKKLDAFILASDGYEKLLIDGDSVKENMAQMLFDAMKQIPDKFEESFTQWIQNTKLQERLLDDLTLIVGIRK